MFCTTMPASRLVAQSIERVAGYEAPASSRRLALLSYPQRGPNMICAGAFGPIMLEGSKGSRSEIVLYQTRKRRRQESLGRMI